MSPVASSPVDAPVVGAQALPLVVARATYDVDPPGTCRRTRATIELTGDVAGRGPATLAITYSVLGTCGGQNGLYYYDFATDGAVAIDSSQVVIDPALRRASVDAVVPVFEAEAGIHSQVRVRASWERTTGDPESAVAASLDVSALWLSPQYLTNPVSPAVDAELRRSVH